MGVLRLAAGEPELVIVDARVLRLLMPGLSQLIILGPVDPQKAAAVFVDEFLFVWDEDDLCRS